MDLEQGGSTLTGPGGAGLAGLAESLGRATGQGARWAARITAGSLLEADLGIDSLELAELNVLLRARFGSGIDLVAFLRALDIEQIINLTVGDVLAYLETVGGGGEGPGAGARAGAADADSVAGPGGSDCESMSESALGSRDGS